MSHSNFLATTEYFSECPTAHHLQEIFENSVFPWDILPKIPQAIKNFIQEQLSFVQEVPINGLTRQEDGSYAVTKSFVLKHSFLDTQSHIFIGQNTSVEYGALIKPYSVVMNDCEIRQGGYLRGQVFIDQHCTVGHSTEIKNSLFMPHTEAGHFNYIGDSLLGSYVNLGAGTKLCNLSFRSLRDKKKETFPPIVLKTGGKPLLYSPTKIGCIIGDGCETGCNSVLGPFVLLGKESQVLPNLYLFKGVYPSQTIFKDYQDCRNNRL